jgi:hypothetical protein
MNTESEWSESQLQTFLNYCGTALLPLLARTATPVATLNTNGHVRTRVVWLHLAITGSF